MTSLLITNKNDFSIDLIISEDKEGGLHAAFKGDDKAVSKLPSLPDESPIKHSFTFRHPNYQVSTRLLESAVELVDGRIKINPATLRYNRIVLLLKSWTLKTDNGADVACNEENIANLYPSVANVLADVLEKRLGE